MTNAHEDRRLSALDTAFLRIERDGLPMHVGMVASFAAKPLVDKQGRLQLGDIRKHVDRRLDDLPRLRRRLATAPLGITRPQWADDHGFDIDLHVDEVSVDGDGPNAGTDEGERLDDFRRMADAILAEPLDRTKPLWHIRFVTGWSRDRIGLVERAHHALVDGVSGVEVEAALLDLAPSDPPTEPSTWQPEPGPSVLSQLLGDPVKRAQQATSLLNPVAMSRSVISQLKYGANAATTVAKTIETLAQDGILASSSSMNAKVGAERRTEFVTADLEAARAHGRQHGATINDVTLNAVANGLRELLLRRGEKITADTTIRALAPVSVRASSERDTLGNRIGAMLVPLPIGIEDPVERLQAIAQATQRVKSRGEAVSTDIAVGAANALPAPAIDLAAGIVHHQPFVHLVVTNVPGPPVPLYLLGSELVDAFPVVPLGGNMTLGVAILSYNGTLGIGVTAGGTGIDDVDIFRKGIEDGLPEAPSA